MGIILDDVSYLDEVKNVSLELEDRKIYGIIGSSYSGKSLLADLISGGLFPSSGDIFLDGKVGMVYQNISDQFFYNNIKDEFIFVLKINDVHNIIKKMNDAIKMVGFNSNILNKSIYELSLSERKRISLALVLACNPDVIILDDLFFGLDGKSQNNIIRIIRLLKFRYGKTIIITSRDSDLIYSICDSVIVINDGDLLKIDDKYNIFKDKALLKKCGLCAPRLIEFSDILFRKKGINIGYRNDINDLVKDIYRFVR